MVVTRAQIQAARNADLYEYLRYAHPDEIKREGNWLRMKSNPSLCTKRGLGGYKDYATLETGNSIDFLTRHMNYDFVTAVTRLTELSVPSLQEKPPPQPLVLPQKAEDTCSIRSYLSGRGFTDEILNRLLSENLLYQDIRRNAVFCSAAGDFFELRGTCPGKVFHQCGKASSDRYWYFMPGKSPLKAYICEGAIDAVSLYLLHMKAGREECMTGLYCGIAGAANQRAIERIRSIIPAVIAVDNDAAGEQCRLRNSSLPALIPMKKDWNEDLISTGGLA